jgi:uncharacterized protein YjbJ (UPF0337 family)
MDFCTNVFHQSMVAVKQFDNQKDLIHSSLRRLAMNPSTHAKHAANDATTNATADKAKGKTKQVIGAVKEKLGHAVGDHELEAKGGLQRADGKKDQFKGEIKEQISNVKDKVKAGVEVAKEKFADARR